MTLERLPPDVTVTRYVLLQPAISPGYDLSVALAKTESGIWSFHSRFDLFFVGLMTRILGTLDGRHCPAAGLSGFHRPPQLTAEGHQLYDTRLHQTPFRAWMCAAFHFGGHMGPTNRVFIAESIAPLLRRTS